jgi:hypothetical protein
MKPCLLPTNRFLCSIFVSFDVILSFKGKQTPAHGVPGLNLLKADSFLSEGVTFPFG